jgi:hypothetical protein
LYIDLGMRLLGGGSGSFSGSGFSRGLDVAKSRAKSTATAAMFHQLRFFMARTLLDQAASKYPQHTLKYLTPSRIRANIPDTFGTPARTAATARTKGLGISLGDSLKMMSVIFQVHCLNNPFQLTQS